jgi:hypothetical protein
MPRGLWGEEQRRDQHNGPCPLDGEGDAESPFVFTLEASTEDAGSDQLANDEALWSSASLALVWTAENLTMLVQEVK